MADRSKQSLVAYDKAGTKVAEGEVGTKQVAITGLEPGTEVAKGDYKVAFTDGTNTSDKVDVPAFTVLTATVPVSGITLSQKTATMTVGDTKTITSTIAPENATNKNITAASDNEKVATFGIDGKITAIGAGTANVTATTVDGGFAASCAVTVSEATVAVTGVTIEPTTASIEVGKTTKLTATVAPDNATDKSVAYKSSDDTKATVASDGTVTAVAVGTADITATTTDGAKTAVCTVTVTEAA